MTTLNGRLATPVESELEGLERRHAEMCGQLDSERGIAARVEVELLTGQAEVDGVWGARRLQLFARGQP